MAARLLDTHLTDCDEMVQFLSERIVDDEHELAAVPSGGWHERMRAEIDVKRDALTCIRHLLELPDQPMTPTVHTQAVHMLRSLALLYADHVEYRARWRPARHHARL